MTSKLEFDEQMRRDLSVPDIDNGSGVSPPTVSMKNIDRDDTQVPHDPGPKYRRQRPAHRR